MTHRAMLAIGLVVSCAVVDTAAGQRAGERDADPSQRDLLVHFVRYASVADVATALRNVYQDNEDVRIVSDESSGMLFMRIPPSRRGEALQMLAAMDRAPNTVSIQVLLIEKQGSGVLPAPTLSGPADVVLDEIRKLESAGQIAVLDRIEISSLEEQRAMVQMGQTVSVVTGATFTPRGRGNSYSRQNVGTMLSVTHRVEDEAISLELQFEKSQLVEDEGESEDVRPPRVTTTTVHTALRIRDGHAMPVEGTSIRSSEGETESMLVVSARRRDGGRSDAGASSRRGVRRSSAARESSRPAERAASSPPGSSADRLRRYVERLVSRYDRNDDGGLDADERSEMSRDPIRADKDGDGRVTVDEYVTWLRERTAR